MAGHSRSDALRMEVQAMDRIERAMASMDDLPEPMQARVRRWVAETYTATPNGDGATPQEGAAQ